MLFREVGRDAGWVTTAGYRPRQNRRGNYHSSSTTYRGSRHGVRSLYGKGHTGMARRSSGPEIFPRRSDHQVLPVALTSSRARVPVARTGSGGTAVRSGDACGGLR